MAKTITIQSNDKEYTLEFTRESVKEMERRGFLIDDIADKPLTVLPALFAGAFLAHHRFVKEKEILAIFEKMPNKQELVGKLAEMYSEPLETLMEDPEDSAGNPTWGASW